MDFEGRETLKGSSIDRLGQTTPFFYNSLFSQKITFKNDKMRSHECLYFYLKHSQSNAFFSLFFCFELDSSFNDTPTKRAERVASDQIDLEVKTQERRSLEQTNQ